MKNIRTCRTLFTKSETKSFDHKLLQTFHGIFFVNFLSPNRIISDQKFRQNEIFIYSLAAKIIAIIYNITIKHTCFSTEKEMKNSSLPASASIDFPKRAFKRHSSDFQISLQKTCTWDFHHFAKHRKVLFYFNPGKISSVLRFCENVFYFLCRSGGRIKKMTLVSVVFTKAKCLLESSSWTITNYKTESSDHMHRTIERSCNSPITPENLGNCYYSKFSKDSWSRTLNPVWKVSIFDSLTFPSSYLVIGNKKSPTEAQIFPKRREAKGWGV